MNRVLALFPALLLAACATTQPTSDVHSKQSGEPPSSLLFQEIAAQDAALGEAFNDHDLDALMALFADDLEFYHDKGGLQRYADVRRGFGGLFGQNNGIRRELIAGSLRVFPIKDFGAVELGSHRFCHVENGKDDCGTFEFVQLWHRVDGGWKITRVISYGH